jgi:hypothetical protein
MSVRHTFIFYFFFVLGGVHGAWAADFSRMELAIETWNRHLLGNAVSEIDKEAHAHPQDSQLAYWQSVGAFHTVLMDKASDERVASVLETVRRAYRLDPGQKEIQAMMCVLYGMRIQNNKLRAVWLGPRVMNLGKTALASPENPRALYLVATCRYYGGRGKKDLEEAFRLFARAEVLFNQESRLPPSLTEPRWGRAECARFLKMTSDKLNLK